jgi:hypothetical protein
VVSGMKAAWKTLTRKPPISGTNRRSTDRLSPSQRSALSLRESGLEDRYSGGYGVGASNGESPRLRSSEGSGLPGDAEDFEEVSKDS